ncbi:MAG: alpha/beta fold hydrolase [Nitrosomonas sp.]|nr:alpha/beta fold hydrolase [Nitrosomonas sp.]
MLFTLFYWDCRFLRYLRSIFLSLMLVSVCAGCVHRQSVTEPYPRWGKEIEIRSHDNRDQLIVRMVHPAELQQAKACVLLVHGMNEYIGRYAAAAHFFAKNFLVAGFDLYAHGLSHPELFRADLALIGGAENREIEDIYLAQIPLNNLDRLRESLDMALQQLIALCDEYGRDGKPIFIVSHSLGSLVAASYLLQNQRNLAYAQRIAGIVFLGPAFAVTEVPGWRGWFANPFIKLSFHVEEHFLKPHNEPFPLMIANQAVSLMIAPVLDGIFEVLSWPGLRSLFTPTTPDWVVDYLTNDEQERVQIRVDGWLIRQTLLRYVKGIEAEIVAFRHQMSKFEWPYYLIYSEHDPITASWGNHDFAQATLHNHPDNQILAYSDLNHHEHLFSAQPLRNEILEKIEQWLDRRLTHLQRSDID